MKRSFDTLSAGVQRKKQKIRSARNIVSESGSASLRDGAIPVQDFLSARKFEIKALSESIKKSREAGVQRAFQSLPRYLRRRAASHNVKRVPKRLRARALLELTEEEQKARHKRIPFKRKRGRTGTIKKLAQIRKKLQNSAQENLPEPVKLPGTDLPATKPLEKGKYVNRQRNKTWLPSHLWTCKRAKMEVRWNYAIAVSPNEKTYRPTHRASTSKGAMVFDTSYRGTILLKGSGPTIAELLQKLTRTKDTCGLRARSGLRAISCHLYEGDVLLCPATVLWDPCGTEQSTSALLLVHPLSFVTVWKIILADRVTCLPGGDNKTGPSVKVVDMRFQIGSIDMIGPLAINAALSVLKPAEDSDCAKAFKSFHGLAPNEISPGLILPLSCKDPRSNFPPQMITEPAKVNNPYSMQCPKHAISSALFQREAMQETNNAKPKSGNLAQGSSPSVPILLYRTRLGISIMAPWAYITDFWYSLNHLPLIRFGGIQEFAQIHYEHVEPFFPTDYHGTSAGDVQAAKERTEHEKWYLRRPPAKRLNFAKVIHGKPEIGDPFACDFHYMVNMMAEPVSSDLSHVSGSIQDRPTLESTTGDITMEDIDVTAPLDTSTPQVRVLDTTPTSVPKQTMSSQPPTESRSHDASMQKSEDNLVPLLLHFSVIDQLTPDQQSRGIMQVRIKLVQRGSPKSRARIYHADGKRVSGNLIGFLTTGNFSLSEGRATGIGSLAAKYIHSHSQVREKHCFVRDVGSSHFRLATWALITSS